jgi:hypothetical protein
MLNDFPKPVGIGGKLTDTITRDRRETLYQAAAFSFVYSEPLLREGPAVGLCGTFLCGRAGRDAQCKRKRNEVVREGGHCGKQCSQPFTKK